MKKILLSLIIVGCATQETKKSGPFLTDKDGSVKRVKPLVYQSKDDYYKSSRPDDSLSTETAERVEEVNKSDALAVMVKNCYEKNFSKAFKIADELYFSFQNIPTYWNQIATCYLMKGEKRKSLLFYNKALDLSSGYAPTLNNIGLYFHSLQDDSKALVAFERALSSSPSAKTPKYNLAHLYLRYSQGEIAESYFRKLYADNPQDPEILQGLAHSLVLQKKWNEALVFFLKLNDKILKKSIVGLHLSLTYLSLGNKAEALRIFNMAQTEESDRELEEYLISILKPKT
jgi:tetratricopeptide (TPR) repeat protein